MTRRPPSRLVRHLGAGLVLTASAMVFGVQGVRADSLPDFRSLVQAKAPVVVSVGVEKDEMQPTAGQDSPFGPNGELPEQLRRFFEQNPQFNPRGGQPPGGMPPGGGMPPPGGRAMGLGSGFIISDDGYIVTNAHVVDGASKMTVTLNDRREMDAKLIGLDEATDIALLKIDGKGLPVAELGDSDKVEVGQWVLAIGSPFGFDHTATQGIISATARNLPSGSYTPFIQTDVAVNPGNSGGPLFDTDGVVVGVNSQIYSSSGGYQGLSFAIPANVVKTVVEQLRTTGKASRGWLGVAIQDVDQSLADAFGLARPNGALVSSVNPDGPASAGGIRQGDIVVDFDGKPVNRSGDLPALVGVVPAGDDAKVTVLRNGERQTIDVTIGEFDNQSAGMQGGPAEEQRSDLGVVVGSLDEEARSALGLEHGVRVREVMPDGPAARAGIQPDDVIVAVGGKPVDSPSAFRDDTQSIAAGKSVPVLVQRGENSLYVAIQAPADQG